MTILLFGEDGATIRPTHAEGTRPWARNPTKPGDFDGTQIDAEWLNAIRALLLNAIVGMNVDASTYGDDLLLQAIQQAAVAGLNLDPGDPGALFVGDGSDTDPLGLDFSAAPQIFHATPTTWGLLQKALAAEALAMLRDDAAVTPATLRNALFYSAFTAKSYMLVEEANRNVPPTSPDPAHLYLVGTAPTGDWAGQANAFAHWTGEAWEFRAPRQGDLAHAILGTADLRWDGVAWVPFIPSTLSNLRSEPGAWQAQQVFQQVSIPPRGYDEVTNGSFVTDSDWVKGPGWSIDPGLGAALSDGSQTEPSDLHQDIAALVNGVAFEVTITVADVTAGTVTPVVSDTLGTARGAPGQYVETITAGAAPIPFFSLRASDDFVGSVSLAMVRRPDQIGWDVQYAQVAHIVLDGNKQLMNPRNLVNGGTYYLVIEQDATGGRLLSYDGLYTFPSGITPSLTTSPGAIDLLSCIAHANGLLVVHQGDFS